MGAEYLGLRGNAARIALCDRTVKKFYRHFFPLLMSVISGLTTASIVTMLPIGGEEELETGRKVE
jgi:hypothetical protein